MILYLNLHWLWVIDYKKENAVQKGSIGLFGQPKVDENLHIRAFVGQIDVLMPKIEHQVGD
jgi:hypothetical protein